MVRRTVLALTVFAVYVAAARAGLSLASINPSATAVWPPTGIALAACLFLGRTAWLPIFAGAFVVNLLNAGTPATSLGIAVGNTLEAVLGAHLAARFAGGRNAFARAPDVFRFAALVAFGCTIVSATIGVTTLALAGFAPWSRYSSIWLTWWLGDASGALIFAPLIVTWANDHRSLRGRWLETACLVVALIGASVFVFAGVYEPTRTHPLAFLCIPPVAWAAIRFGPRESSTATAALSLMATWNTHRGVGPFAPVGDDSLLVLQSFMATVANMTMAMAGLVAERARVEEERRRLLAAEQRARTAVEAAMRAKDQFLAMLGHELRNPLGSIVTAIHVLDRSAVLRNDAAKARDVLRRQADHLTHLVDDLLDATRVATGKMTVHRRPVDLAALTSQVVEAFEAAGRTVNHELVVDAQPVHVDGDPMRLEQVVSNLVGNALKFTPAGGTIHVSVAQADGTATLRVADTGIGIPPDLLPQIFELFAQGTRGLDRAEGGLGIGLTLVKHIVELHDGAIDVRTDGPGRGCEFAVRLRAVPRPTSGSESEGRGAPAGRTVARRVLVVEDQADMREILRIAIEGAGHVVAEAADGPGGVEAARRFRPDVALVDIGLPGFDGYEVARRIRALAGPSPVVLVALTGYGQPEDRQRAQAAGFDVHLVKPIEMDRVDELLATWSPARRQVGL